MSTFKLICIGIAVVLVLPLLLIGCDLDGADNSAVAYIPYDKINQYLLFHHIVYDGEDYYIMDTDEYDVPDEYVPFGDSVYVTLVDKDGEPYDPERREEAFTYQNDEEKMYLYYISAKYTKDKSKASKALGLSD